MPTALASCRGAPSHSSSSIATKRILEQETQAGEHMEADVTHGLKGSDILW